MPWLRATKLSDERIEQIGKGQTSDLFAREAIIELLWEVKRLKARLAAAEKVCEERS